MSNQRLNPDQIYEGAGGIYLRVPNAKPIGPIIAKSGVYTTPWTDQRFYSLGDAFLSSRQLKVTE